MTLHAHGMLLGLIIINFMGVWVLIITINFLDNSYCNEGENDIIFGQKINVMLLGKIT